jgi:hypothetical protein
MQAIGETIVVFVAIFFGLHLLDRFGYGLEDIIERALNATVVPNSMKF